MLNSKTFFQYILLLGIILSFSLPAGAAAKRAEQEELKKAVLAILKENPDLVLDILRDNSEVVLDIAQQGSDLRRQKALITQWRKDLEMPKKVALANRPSRGSEKAPVTIVAFLDFTCLYCQQSEKTLNNILLAYGDQVRIVYKILPMSSHPGAQEAASFMLAGYLQDPKKSWVMFEDFFNNRDKIIGKSSDAYLRSAGVTAGFNMQKLINDAKSKKITSIMEGDEEDARRLNVQGTPYLLINNIIVRGALPEHLMHIAVDMALKAKK